MSDAPEDRKSGHEENPRVGRRSWGPSEDQSGQPDNRALHVAARAVDQLPDDRDAAEARQPVAPRPLNNGPAVVPRERPEAPLGAEPGEEHPEADQERREAAGSTSETAFSSPSPATGSNPTAAAGALAPACLLPPQLAARFSAGELIEQLAAPPSQRSTRGWRALFGMRPGPKEMDEIRDVELVKTTFRRPVTIMVANPKGGSGKTPTSLLLAAALGHARGGGVVAWDNNELRGTLPDRSDSPHRRNVHDLLESLDRLRWSASSFTDLAFFLNHQSNGNFFTLGSAQHSGQVVTGQNFRQVHELFCRYFQIIVVDTGNNEVAPNWTAAAAEADCLVVPTKWRKDSLIPAAHMLESLQDTNPGLLERTVIAATNGPMDSQRDVKDKSASWFGSNHPIVDIPVDTHIAEGCVIDWSRVKEPTRRAALRLAAEVATRLVEAGHKL